jgi:peroxidase
MALCSLIRRSRMAALMMVVLVSAAPAALDAAGGLDMEFYSKTCPEVEKIVRDEMVKILKEAPSLAGPLLRLHFHDCFIRVRHCNANCHCFEFGQYNGHYWRLVRKIKINV